MNRQTKGVYVPCVSFAPQQHIEGLCGFVVFKIKSMTYVSVVLLTCVKATRHGRSHVGQNITCDQKVKKRESQRKGLESHYPLDRTHILKVMPFPQSATLGNKLVTYGPSVSIDDPNHRTCKEQSKWGSLLQ